MMAKLEITYDGILYVKGQTFYVKEKLKEIGFKWDPLLKSWYIKLEENKVDEYIKKLSEFTEVKIVYDVRKYHRFYDFLKSLNLGNLQYKVLKEVNDIVKEMLNGESFWNNGDMYIVFDNGVYYFIREDIAFPEFHAYARHSEISKFKDGSFEEFLKKKYIPAEVAEKMKKEFEERKRKEISIIPVKDKEKELKELVRNMKDKEVYLLDEYNAKFVKNVLGGGSVKIYRGAFLWGDSRYILAVNVLDFKNLEDYNTIYLIRDDSRNLENILSQILGKPIEEGDWEVPSYGDFETADEPLAEVPERIERALKESYSFKTFSYTYSPYVIIERLYDYERGKFDGIVVKGYTALIEDVLKDLGFFKTNGEIIHDYMFDKEDWAKFGKNLGKVVEELKSRIPQSIKVIDHT